MAVARIDVAVLWHINVQYFGGLVVYSFCGPNLGYLIIEGDSSVNRRLWGRSVFPVESQQTLIIMDGRASVRFRYSKKFYTAT